MSDYQNQSGYPSGPAMGSMGPALSHLDVLTNFLAAQPKHPLSQAIIAALTGASKTMEPHEQNNFIRQLARSGAATQQPAAPNPSMQWSNPQQYMSTPNSPDPSVYGSNPQRFMSTPNTPTQYPPWAFKMTP